MSIESTPSQPLPDACVPQARLPERRRKSRQNFEVQLDRWESKYIIPSSLVPEIREYIRPFCVPDSNCTGNPPEYVNTTLQLDGPGLPLHHAKERDELERFKLRIRTYGTDRKAPVFLEVKRKFGGTIVKSRASVPAALYNEDIVQNVCKTLPFRSSDEWDNYLEFVRLTREIWAEPVVLIRYIRESYRGWNDHYARVTFDRALTYRPTRSYDLWPQTGHWIPMDTGLSQQKMYPFSGVVLELKSLSHASQWMVDMVECFALEQTGNCKYSTAIWQEALFRGVPAQPAYAVELLTF